MQIVNMHDAIWISKLSADTVKIKSLFAAISVHVSIEFVIKSLFLILTVDMTLGDKHTHTKLLYYSGSFQIQVLLSIFFMAVDY